MIYVERYRYLSRLDSTRDVELSRRRPRPGSCIFVQLKQARSVRAYHAKMHTVSSRLEGGRIGAFPVGATPEMGLRSVFGTGSATRRAKGNVRLVRWRWTSENVAWASRSWDSVELWVRCSTMQVPGPGPNGTAQRRDFQVLLQEGAKALAILARYTVGELK
ncbi:uncharacterized protein CC84DRAFT_721343 [Paraphaeosphaeria sporulosa]|uniref:Uncharacterized protein n=1 Tax=Paraphaeosphaeria sporulosa TaxID=1460663 RepID=A0A177CDJ5_9PLEO|nr:uncharacterized protein CC84DRAFT_721343 [Paraphaeosphaeria sporulosa]OAG05386.1 hypothetical protein CC84DRAFT_721343 [Paraphaeosphaeria sporulosa]